MNENTRNSRKFKMCKDFMSFKFVHSFLPVTDERDGYVSSLLSRVVTGKSRVSDFCDPSRLLRLRKLSDFFINKCSHQSFNWPVNI